MYLSVPIVGYICDRYSPRPLSFLSSFLFSFGYLLAAFTYQKGPIGDGRPGWPPQAMVLAFVFVGLGTACMYLSAVTTCAKNFGRGKYKGLALAIPSAAFGLSAVWESQVGSQLLYEMRADGSKGDVDVFKYFIFLAITLAIVGVIGAIGLQVVDEEELIDEAVEELHRSGLLEDSPFFRRDVVHDANGYGTIDNSRSSTTVAGEEDNRPVSRAPSKEDEAQRKTWLLNGETRRFLSDRTMWLLFAGFFLVTGPGETFLNNLGTIIGTLYLPPSEVPSSNSAATNVSILALTSTISRLALGLISDLFAPSLPTSDLDCDDSNSSSQTLDNSPKSRRLPAISRVIFLLISLSAQVLAFILLASPLVSSHPETMVLISGLLGAGYGGCFSLTPIIISVVWGVQNFGTNWGIIAMVPAGGAAIWSAVYSAVYMAGAKDGDGGLCWGTGCWVGTVWAWLICGILAGILWIWAWRGRGGWKERGLAL